MTNTVDETRPDPTHIPNHDVLMLWDVCNRIKEEVNKSQSANASGMSVEADRNRFKTFMASLIEIKKWVQAEEGLDLPKTHPRPYPIEIRVISTNRESEVANMIDHLVDAYMTGLIHSESAQMSSGILQPGPREITLGGETETITPPSTGLRLDLIVDKMVSFLKGYVMTQTPQDYVETSPRATSVEHGAGAA